jgi:nicotinamidase-related amidase
VTFTRFVAPAVPVGSWRRYYEQWPFALRPPDATIYHLVDAFVTEPGPTLDATTFGKWTPELAAKVDGGRLVLAGVSTDCCVLSTALAAADAGITVQVAADACAGVDDASHAKALDILRLYGPLVEVTSVAEILAAERATP